MKLVMVEWEDSYASDNWTPKRHLGEEHIAKCCSVGIMAKQDEHGMTIIKSLSENNYGDAITIPMGCIKRIRELKVK